MIAGDRLVTGGSASGLTLRCPAGGGPPPPCCCSASAPSCDPAACRPGSSPLPSLALVKLPNRFAPYCESPISSQSISSLWLCRGQLRIRVERAGIACPEHRAEKTRRWDFAGTREEGSEGGFTWACSSSRADKPVGVAGIDAFGQRSAWSRRERAPSRPRSPTAVG